MRREEGLVSRQLKLIPNRFVRRTLEDMGLHYCDGELLTYSDGKWDDFNTVQSKIMTEGGQPNFVWFMFDHFQNQDMPYAQRYTLVPQGVEPYTKKLFQQVI